MAMQIVLNTISGLFEVRLVNKTLFRAKTQAEAQAFIDAYPL